MLQPYLIVIVVISCLPYHCRGFSRFHVVDTRRRSWRTRTPCSWNARGVLCERANTRPDERARQHGSVSNWRPSMSVQDMIGADVESGGLFDPLGENVLANHRTPAYPRCATCHPCMTVHQVCLPNKLGSVAFLSTTQHRFRVSSYFS